VSNAEAGPPRPKYGESFVLRPHVVRGATAAPSAQDAGLTDAPHPGGPLPDPQTASNANHRARARQAADREFLPAAIEILETPPSPVSTALIWFMFVATLAVLSWSYFGQIDIHAIANGRIQPSGRSKIVQPLETGKVAVVHVHNGDQVNQGDVLLELEGTETSAEMTALRRDVDSLAAEVARRHAAVEGAGQPMMAAPAIAFASSIDEGVRLREEQVLQADLADLAASRSRLEAQRAEKIATRDRLMASIAARERLIALSRERVEMRETLTERGAGSRALTIEAQQQLETQLAADVADRSQMVETEAAMRSLTRQIDEAVSRFVADQTSKRADAQRKLDHLAQDLIKARAKNAQTRLRAPITGIVQQLAVTTIGQVVGSGQALLTIVPQDASIEVEAQVLNQDIGFVDIGQHAVVKVEAFPFTRYGTLDGLVTNVSRDGVDQRDPSTLGDASAVTKPGGSSATTQGQNLVFPATIKLDQRAIMVDGRSVPLVPGMAVIVEIKTGQRRVIDYLLSPIRTAVSQAGHER
jgi:hemolysin D